MTPPAHPERYKNHRFPGEIISHGVWLYYRFTLSSRDVQELLFERGITVSHARGFCATENSQPVHLSATPRHTSRASYAPQSSPSCYNLQEAPAPASRAPSMGH